MRPRYAPSSPGVLMPTQGQEDVALGPGKTRSCHRDPSMNRKLYICPLLAQESCQDISLCPDALGREENVSFKKPKGKE